MRTIVLYVTLPRDVASNAAVRVESVEVIDGEPPRPDRGGGAGSSWEIATPTRIETFHRVINVASQKNYRFASKALKLSQSTRAAD